MDLNQSDTSNHSEKVVDEKEKSNLTRRDFFTSAGTGGLTLGAGLLLGAAPNPLWAASGQNTSLTAEHTATPIGWSNSFHPSATAPLYPTRQAPKPGEKIHEFNIEVGVSVHELVPGVKIHAFTYNLRNA